jgi:hypothetical protein
MEADDDFKYVLKFKGAGHGVKALIAELIGEIARALGMKMPELVLQISTRLLDELKPMRKSRIYCRSQGMNLALHSFLAHQF